MSKAAEKITIKELADELGVSKNTVRNQLIKAGYDLAQYKENGVIKLDKELISVARSIDQELTGKLTRQLPVNEVPNIVPSEREFLFLKEQLIEKDKQISELTQMVRDQQKLTFLQQQKNDQLLIENQELKQRKWWQFWKSN